MKKEAKGEVVHDVGFGKREGFADPAGETLTEGVVESLDMVGFSFLFSHRTMLVVVKDGLIRGVKVTVAWTGLVRLG